MSLKITPVKKQQACSVLGWVISSRNKLCPSKETMRFTGLRLTCEEAFVYVVAVEKAPYIHREPMLIFIEGGSRGFGESKLKRNVFSDSEALAIVFPTAIVQIDYTNVHITLLTNVLVG